MKSLIMYFMGIALISVGCVWSPSITQGNYLVHQEFIELSKGNYSMAEANLLVSLDIEPENPMLAAPNPVSRAFHFTTRTFFKSEHLKLQFERKSNRIV
jgi:hypothetical protein